MNKCRKIIIGLKKLKIQVIKREKKKEEERIKKKKKKENSTELQKPTWRQRFITTIKSVTEYTHTYTPIRKIKTVQQK